MKKIKLLIVSGFLLAGSFTYGQDLAKTPQDRAQEQTSMYTEKYNLTEDQKLKAYEINLGVERKNEAIQSDVNMSAETKQQALQGNLDAREQMIQSILTEEQKKLDQKKRKNYKIEKAQVQPNVIKFD